MAAKTRKAPQPQAWAPPGWQQLPLEAPTREEIALGLVTHALPYLRSLLSRKAGGRGAWSKWEYEHQDQAEELPISYHLKNCSFTGANHYSPALPCRQECLELRALIEESERLLEEAAGGRK